MLDLLQAMEARATGDSVTVRATGELARVVDYVSRRYGVAGSRCVKISVGSGVGMARVEWVTADSLSIPQWSRR